MLKYFPENIKMNKGHIRGFEQALKLLAEYPTAEGVFLPMVVRNVSAQSITEM